MVSLAYRIHRVVCGVAMSLDESVANRPVFFKYLGYRIRMAETMAKVMQVLALGQNLSSQDQQQSQVLQPPSSQLFQPACLHQGADVT